jgi:hypothetical protein
LLMWHCITGCDSHLDVDVALGVLDFTLLFFNLFCLLCIRTQRHRCHLSCYMQIIV